MIGLFANCIDINTDPINVNIIWIVLNGHGILYIHTRSSIATCKVYLRMQRVFYRAAVGIISEMRSLSSPRIYPDIIRSMRAQMRITLTICNYKNYNKLLELLPCSRLRSSCERCLTSCMVIEIGYHASPMGTDGLIRRLGQPTVLLARFNMPSFS